MARDIGSGITTVRESLAFAKGYLIQHGVESADLDARVLFGYVYEMSDGKLLAAGNMTLADDLKRKRFTSMLRKRSRGCPVAYLTGEKEFYSLPFYVNEYVLIPRPDTEALVDAVIGYLRLTFGRGQKARVLDIGSGSGCVSVAVAKSVANVSVLGVDVSNGALSTSVSNAARNGVSDKTLFIRSDIYSDVSGMFDVIMSNPPYIPTADIAKLDADVREFEPKSALDGGRDGLDFYRAIASGAWTRLNRGGGLFLEVGAGQSKAVKNVLTMNGFSEGNVRIVKDLSGIERVVWVTV